MLAWFHKGVFQNFRQDQRDLPDYVGTTAQALNQKPSDVAVFVCPALRNDQVFYFDEEKRLVTGQKIMVPRPGAPEGVTMATYEWDEPQELEQFWPKQ